MYKQHNDEKEKQRSRWEVGQIEGHVEDEKRQKGRSEQEHVCCVSMRVSTECEGW